MVSLAIEKNMVKQINNEIMKSSMKENFFGINIKIFNQP